MVGKFKKSLIIWMLDVSGVTGIEYGLVAGGVTLGLASGAALLGDSALQMLGDGLTDFMSQGLTGESP